MFGKNEIVGKTYFSNAPDDSLLVTSMFYTIQGEGPLAGLPAYFVRLAKCQLNCSFCDTYFDSGDWMTFDEINKKIDNDIFDYYKDKKRKFSRKDVGLILTGGEPTLQSNLSAFLTEEMCNSFMSVQIESNGILHLSNLHDDVIFVVSPKCIEKNGVAQKYIKPHKKVLERADCLKFVMEDVQGSPYSEIPDWAFEWREDNSWNVEIYASPMNVYNNIPRESKQIRSNNDDIDMETRSTKDEVISFWEPELLDLKSNEKNHMYVAKYCIDNCVKMNLQMHIYAGIA